MRTQAGKQTYGVDELAGRTDIDAESGSLIVYHRFRVQREGGESHIVEVEMTESPQGERCDCRGYKYRGHCAHIQAVYESGLISVTVD